jgi:syntaxin 1B/2/3
MYLVARSSSDAVLVSNQLKRLHRDLLSVAQQYYTVQTKYKSKKRTQLTKQLYIIKSNATTPEINTILDSTDDLAHALFHQDMLVQALGSKRIELKDAQLQRTQLQKISASIVELVAMFQEMEAMLKNQETQVIEIDCAVESTVRDVEAANVELDKGIEYRVRFRRKARIVSAVVFVLICVAGVVLYFIISGQVDSGGSGGGGKVAAVPESQKQQ